MKNLGIAALFVLLIAGGCASKNNIGHYVEDKQISDIKILNTTKEEILNRIGSPSIISDYDKNTWYYISRNTKSRISSTQKLVSQRMLVLQFNESDKVSDIKFIEDKSLPNPHISKDTTVVDGTDKGAIISYIHNIGRFVPKSGKKKK
jgi:hypothetical protein